MIEYVLAAEFDNKQGAGIAATFPDRNTNEGDQLLADYLIPDGMHRTDKDNYVFRSVIAVPAKDLEREAHEFNELKARVNLYIYKDGQRSLQDNVQITQEQSFAFVAEVVELKFLAFKYQLSGLERHKVFVFHHHIDLKKISDRMYTLTAEDDSVYILDFQRKSDGLKMNYLAEVLTNNILLKQKLDLHNPAVILKSGWFFNLCSHKKDAGVERGAIYRSIALFSSRVNIFEFFRPAVARTMELFMRLPPKSTWSFNETQAVLDLMKHLHQECNSLISNDFKTNLRIESNSMIHPAIPVEILVHQGFGEPQSVQLYQRLFGQTSKLLVEMFGPAVMVLYRALLAEANVVFFGDKLKVEQICGIVTASLALVAPLNISNKIFPFEHIQSLEIVKETAGFVAGYTNPLVKQSKVIPWDYLVDISARTIVDNSLKPPLVTIENDRIFIENILKRCREDELEGTEVDSMFYEYTKTNLDVMLNKSNVIRFDKEDNESMQSIFRQSSDFRKTRFFHYLDIHFKNEREEFQTMFGNKYLPVYQAFKMMTESDKFEDMDLIVAYEALRMNLIEAEKIDFYLKKLQDRRGDLECITLGLYSEDAAIRETNQKLLKSLEQSRIWQEYSGSASLFKSILLNETSNRTESLK